MTLVLTPDLEKLIEQRMRSGRYATPADVVAAALCSLDQDETMGEFGAGELNRLLEQGEKSGPPLDGDQVLAELRGLRDKR